MNTVEQTKAGIVNILFCFHLTHPDKCSYTQEDAEKFAETFVTLGIEAVGGNAKFADQLIKGGLDLKNKTEN